MRLSLWPIIQLISRIQLGWQIEWKIYTAHRNSQTTVIHTVGSAGIGIWGRSLFWSVQCLTSAELIKTDKNELPSLQESNVWLKDTQVHACCCILHSQTSLKVDACTKKRAFEARLGCCVTAEESESSWWYHLRVTVRGEQSDLLSSNRKVVSPCVCVCTGMLRGCGVTVGGGVYLLGVLCVG